MGGVPHPAWVRLPSAQACPAALPACRAAGEGATIKSGAGATRSRRPRSSLWPSSAKGPAPGTGPDGIAGSCAVVASPQFRETDSGRRDQRPHPPRSVRSPARPRCTARARRWNTSPRSCTASRSDPGANRPPRPATLRPSHQGTASPPSELSRLPLRRFSHPTAPTRPRRPGPRNGSAGSFIETLACSLAKETTSRREPRRDVAAACRAGQGDDNSRREGRGADECPAVPCLARYPIAAVGSGQPSHGCSAHLGRALRTPVRTGRSRRC